MRHALLGSLAFAAMLGAAAVANDAQALLSTPVTVNPEAAGLIGETKVIDRFSQTYGSSVIQTVVGNFDGVGDTFVETGVFVVNVFQNGGSNVGGTGLNSTYQIYGTFTATGTASLNATGTAIESSFSSFAVALFLDPGFDTIIDTSNGGSIGGIGGDIQIATGTLNPNGENRATTSLISNVRGDFEVLIDFEADHPFFQGSPFSILLALDGTVNVVGGPSPVPPSTGPFPLPGDYVIDVQGDGRGIFAIPEPTALTLVGSALLGLGLLRRRRTA